MHPSGTGHQIIENILKETPLCEDSEFVVVKDAKPVTEDHYLLVTRRPLRSLADTDSYRLESFLMHDFVEACLREYIILEHGHGQFCSTLGDFVHAHAHLVPMSAFNVIDFQYGPSVSYDSLAAALKSVPTNCEYLLWGRLGATINIIVGPEMPKRAIRMQLEKAKER